MTLLKHVNEEHRKRTEQRDKEKTREQLAETERLKEKTFSMYPAATEEE